MGGENDKFYFKNGTLGNTENKSDPTPSAREEHGIDHNFL